MIDADYVSELENEVQDLTTELHSCFHRIEELQAALREVLSLGDWGANILARTVILEALETKYEQLKEGA
jgi:DNA anti-recombination protein RmuC